MKNKIIVDGKEYYIGFPQCRGCEHSIVGYVGWECGYMEGTKNCEHPNTFLMYEAKRKGL